MKKENPTPTMKDVAKEAGVALGTVSKVVNGLPVGYTYRKRVEEAIKKLNYQVNTYAQGMKAGKTYTVALLLPNTRHPFFASLAHYINLALSKQKYRMLLCSTDFDLSIEQEYVNMAQLNKVDGIIGLTYNPDLIVEEGTPFVAIDRPISARFPCVASDNFAGGQLAAEKLSDLGCKHVAFLRTGSSLRSETNKRRSGFENGCLSRGLSYEMKILNDEDSYAPFEEFLTEHIRDGKLSFDGIFCSTDKLAWLITKSLEKLGQRVPEDVQVIGYDGICYFDNDDYICSTIVQPVQEIAEMCVDLLLRESVSTKPPLVCLPVTYAYGGTTKDLPSAPAHTQKEVNL